MTREEENQLWEKVAERVRFVLYRARGMGEMSEMGRRKVAMFIDKLPMSEEERVLSEHYFGFVKKIAVSHWHKRGWWLGFSIADLTHEGFFGLIKAIRRFNRSLGNQFTTYAAWWIKQEIVRFMDHHGRLIDIPANKQEKLRTKKGDEYDEFRRDLPSAYLFNEKENWERVVSLDDNDYPPIPSSEEIVINDDLRDERRKFLSEALLLLAPRDRKILALRFGLNGNVEEMTLEKVAARFDVSRQRIQQREAHAKRMLKNFCPELKKLIVD